MVQWHYETRYDDDCCCVWGVLLWGVVEEITKTHGCLFFVQDGDDHEAAVNAAEQVEVLESWDRRWTLRSMSVSQLLALSRCM